MTDDELDLHAQICTTTAMLGCPTCAEYCDRTMGARSALTATTGETPDNTALVGEFDATKWAAEFVATARKKPAIATDEGTMLAWFAGAIMAGYDYMGNRERARVREIAARMEALRRMEPDMDGRGHYIGMRDEESYGDWFRADDVLALVRELRGNE